MFNLKKFKSILSLLFCSLFIIPVFQSAKCLPINQTVSIREKAYRLKEFEEYQQYIVNLATDHGREYHKILGSTHPHSFARYEDLQNWEKKIFEYLQDFKEKENIYISTYFFKLICCQKRGLTFFPSLEWCQNLKNVVSISIELVDPIKKNYLFPVAHPPAEGMIQMVIWYSNAPEEYIYI